MEEKRKKNAVVKAYSSFQVKQGSSFMEKAYNKFINKGGKRPYSKTA